MLMRRHNISGIPVVEQEISGKPAPLVGILTNRDVRFADDATTPVSQLMTKKVITVREGVTPDEARRLLHSHRIGKAHRGRRRGALRRAPHGQGHGEGDAVPQRLQRRRRAPAGRRRLDGRRQGVRALRAN